MTNRRRESPVARVNPSGDKVWCARWTDRSGHRHYGLKSHGIPGTYKLKRDAQTAIDACHDIEDKGAERPSTVGAYAQEWDRTHPRAASTQKTNRSRLRAVLDVKLDGVPLRDWPMDQLRRRHANMLLDVLLREQGRARSGAMNVLGTLSALFEAAIDDEVAVANPFRGVRVRPGDPRIQKGSRPVRTWSWGEMHAFARACGDADRGGPELAAWRRVYAEPMIRVLSDCGLRAGEMLALCRSDLSFGDGTLTVGWSVSLGRVVHGTKTDHGEVDAGRVVPVPPELLVLLDGMPKRIDAVVRRGGVTDRLLFPTPRGLVWAYHHWLMSVWDAGRQASGMDMRPHEMRHSQISLLRAAGVDPADLAEVSGHSVQTATGTYVHAMGRSFDAIRKAVGE
jgi:integrase